MILRHNALSQLQIALESSGELVKGLEKLVTDLDYVRTSVELVEQWDDGSAAEVNVVTDMMEHTMSLLDAAYDKVLVSRANIIRELKKRV